MHVAGRKLCVGAIAALWLGVCACGSDQPVSAPPIPVTVWTIGNAGPARGLRYSANIRPDVQVDLAFKVGGYVEEILEVPGADGRRRRVQEGDYVQRSTLLARVRDNEYRDRVTEAQAELTRAKADFSRAARLFENQSIAKADYDASHAGLTSAQARYDQAQQTFQDCRLVAPLDGWVLSRTIEVGTLANAGTAAFVIADTRAVKAVFGVPDMGIGALRMGDAQTVTSDALPGIEFRGNVTRISPSADANSRVFEVECTIPNPDNHLKVGMVAALELAPHTSGSPTTMVPLGTIVRPRTDRNGYAVFVAADDAGKLVARERRVTLGDVAGNSVIVLDGLQPGERVIVRGSSLVLDGSEIRIIP